MNEAAAVDVNVAAWLPHRAASQPEALAVAVARRDGSFARLTCAELDALCDRAAHGLLRAGIGPGTRTVLMVKPSPEFFALTFALFKLGAVPVLVDPGMGLANLKQCLAEAEPTAFIGIPRAHAARRLLGWAKATLEVLVTVGPRLLWGGHGFAQLLAGAPDTPFDIPPSAPDRHAAILFTSGSTGVPKGVVYSHGNFAAQVELLQRVYGIAPGEVDLSTFPLFALFGPALGMASVVPWMDASRPAACDPARLVAAIEAFACTNMFASPALVDKLGRHCAAAGRDLPTLRRVISAGAPARNDALERLSAHLAPGVEIFTPYGATEALPVSSIGSRTILGETRTATDRGAGVCVGHPVPGVEVAVIGITDDPIPEWSDDLRLPAGAVGEICVRGPVVTRSYYNRPRSTAQAKIAAGGDVWHRMGDIGSLDAAGRLWMCGRKAHRVDLDAGTLFTIPCEAVFNVHPSVRRTALVGVAHAGATRPVLCVELEPGARWDAALIAELRALGRQHRHTESIDTFLRHPSFPVDVRHNAKIFRERLAVWAGRQGA